MDRHVLFGFTNVDQTADPNYFIRFLGTTSSHESSQGCKRRSFSLLEIKSGQHILELGGGTGDDARALAVMVGPQGRVDCVDNSQAMVDEARKRVAGSGLPVFLQVGDAHHLSFADNAFDASRSDRMFMHLEDPSQSLREMVRVTRPGGLVLVYEVDYRAVRFIRVHAKDHGMDPDRLGIMGGSSGGFLALSIGTAGKPGDQAANDPVDQASSRVQAVACFNPACDLVNYGKVGRSIVEFIRSSLVGKRSAYRRSRKRSRSFAQLPHRIAALVSQPTCAVRTTALQGPGDPNRFAHEIVSGRPWQPHRRRSAALGSDLRRD